MRRAPWLLAGLLAAAPIASSAQPADKVFRIGFLANTIPQSEVEQGAPSHPAAVALVQGLRSLGWRDGHNVRIVWKSAAGEYERLPRLADELVRVPVDVIVAFGPGVTAAARATKTVPIVMVTYYSPAESGLAATLRRPGGNVTGMTLSAGNEQHQKRLALLKEAAPGISRVAWMAQAQSAAEEQALHADLRSPAFAASVKGLGLEVFGVTFAQTEGLKAAIQEAVRRGAQALVFGDIPLLHYREHQQSIAEEAARHRLPVIHYVLSAPANGALMAYGPDIMVNYRRAPYFVDRILKGAAAGDIPIEQPSNFQFHLNLKAAKDIGLQVPAALVVRADRLIE